VYSWDHPKLATPGQYPHEATLVWTGTPPIPSFHGCGGAIITNLWILSSAFCLVDIRDLTKVLIKVGSHDILRDDLNVKNVEIEKVITHEKYPT
jgi:secreted trypsin-like serine protease